MNHLLEHLPRPSCVIFAGGYVVSVNRGFREAIGRDLDALNEQGGLRDMLRDASALETARLNGDSKPVFTHIRTNDGLQGERPVKIEALPEDNSIHSGYLLTIDDVLPAPESSSDMHQYQRAQLLDLTYEPVFVWELGGRITYWNRGAEELYGFSRDEAIGCVSHELLHTYHGQSTAEFMRGLLEAGHWVGELVHHDRSGRSITVESRHQVIREADGRTLVLETNRDVSARKHAADQVRQEREWLQTLLASIGDAVIATDQHGAITLINSVAASLTGWTPEDAVGRPLTDVFRIINDDSRELVTDPVKLVLSTGQIQGLANHTLLVSRDGNERPIDDSAAHIRDEAGQILGVILVFRDISDRYAADRNLQLSELRFRSMANAMPQVVWMADPDGTTQYYNDRVTQFAGVVGDRLKGWSWKPFIHPDDLRPTSEAWRVAVETMSPYSMEHRIMMANGDYRWHLSRAQPVTDETGALVRWFGTATDIDELKRVESALKESEERYHLLFENNPTPAWVSDYQTLRLIDVNRAALGLLGFERDELLALTIEDLRPEEERARLRDQLERDRRGMESHFSSRVRTKDGRVIDVETTWQIVEINGQASRLTVVNDVSERLRAAAEMERAVDLEHQARETAERALAVRDEFFSIAAHELRTPITVLRGHSQLNIRRLRNGRDLSPDKIAEAFAAIDSQSQKLQRLVDQMLDLTRIETGRLTLELRPTDVSALVRHSVNNIKMSVTDRDIRVDIAGTFTASVDALRFEQVLLNLLDNAVKYSPAARPIDVRLRAEQNGLILDVRDYGTGITESDFDRIFLRFEQATLVNRGKGLGLGLYVTRQIVDLHGGHIHVEAPAGGGACFVVWLPLEPPANA